MLNWKSLGEALRLRNNERGRNPTLMHAVRRNIEYPPMNQIIQQVCHQIIIIYGLYIYRCYAVDVFPQPTCLSSPNGNAGSFKGSSLSFAALAIIFGLLEA